MISYTSELLGKLTIRQNGRRYGIQIRRGNCLAVFIHVRKMETWEKGYEKGRYWHSLYNFFVDEQHLKRCIERCGDMFDDEIVSIRLNTYYKESMTLARYMTRCGHRVTLYYKQPKETKQIKSKTFNKSNK